MIDRTGWAAGFFDGEGCISIARRRHKGKAYYSLKLDMFQVDRTPLDIFVLTFGGSIRARPISPYATFATSRDGWVWCQCGHPAAETLKAMVPYLVVKRAQAEIAIEFQSKKINRGPATNPDFERERQQFEEIKRLKIIK